MTTTKTQKTTKQQRTMQFIQTGLVNLLWIKQGNKTNGYMLEDTSAYTNADSSTFRLTKTDGTVYNVMLDGPASLCDCIGFEHRGMNTKDGKGCKHVAALTKLQQLEKIVIPHYKASVAPSAGQHWRTRTMNTRKYQEAMASLEQLHWHLHLNGGPDMWTAELLRQFQAAVKDNTDEPADDELVYIGKEPPQPAA